MDTSNLENRIAMLEQQMREHYHDGFLGRQISVLNLIDVLKTVTVAAELTNILASKPKSLVEQLFIDTTTATKKLYIYDAVGSVWRSVTIA